MSKKYKTQEVSLELLKLFDQMCRKHQLTYTLIGDTLWGAVKCNGFLPNACDAKVAMPYKDYIQFIEISRKALEGTNYYIVNHDIDPRLEIVFSQLAKRSRVILTGERKKDEIFYDYTIDIIPIINVCDQQRAFERKFKQYQYLCNIVAVRDYPKGFKKKSKWRYYCKTKPLLKQNRQEAMKQLKEICRGNDDSTKYVFLGNNETNQAGSCLLGDTYKELVETEFEGESFWILKKAEQWLIDFYKKEYDQKIEEMLPNVFLLKGPEELRRVQLVQIDILKEIDRICRKHHINYFLCSGTLLGAIRHGGYIPWDYDADVAMPKKDYDRFLEVAEKELDHERFFARHKKTEPTIHITYTQIRRFGTSFIRQGRENNKKANHGILVDIFPVYNGGDTWIKHRLQTKLAMFYKTMFWTHNGAKSEKKKIKRMYYEFLAKWPPEFAYKQYMKYATKYENKETKKIAWLVAKNNPYFSRFTDKEVYMEYIDIEFEGYQFRTIKHWQAYLEATYSAGYLLFPERNKRFNRFVASGFDAGDLYPYEEEEKSENVKG